MKKAIILLVCGLVLAGCSSNKYVTQISDASTTIVSDDKLTITKQDFYEYLLENNGADEVLNEALSAIADKEVTDEDEINDLLKEKADTYAQYAGGSLADYATSLGYDSEDDYKEQVLLPSVKQELLKKKYIEEHYEDLIKEFNVCSIKKIVVEKESSALSIIKKATDEDAFDSLMDTYDDKAEDCGIVTKNSTLDDNLQEKLSDFVALEEDGIYSEAIKLSDDTYAAVFVYDTDLTENKDTYIDTLTSDSDVQTTVEGYYLKEYNFTVNESKIKAAIKELSSEYISD
jgi:hypothetical protein